MKKNSFYVIIVVAFLVFWNHDLFAQGCVQCRIGPSSNMEGGGKVARGINSGILYLMLIPYLLIMTIVCYVFREQLNEKWMLLKAFFGRKVVQH